MRFYRRLRNESLSWKWLALISFMFPYFYHSLLKFQEIFGFYDLSINQWDLFLYSLNDMNFIFYFLLPIWLYFSSITVMKESNELILIRNHSFTRWLIYVTIKASKSLIFFQVLWLTILLSLTREMTYEAHWSNFAMSVHVPSNLSWTLQQEGWNPLAALVLQLLLLFLFFIILHISLAFCYSIIRHRSSMTITCLLYFIGALVSLKMIDPSVTALKIENYMFLASAEYAFSSVWFAFMTPAIVGCIFFCLLWLLKDSNGLSIRHRLKNSNYKLLIYLSICIIGLLPHTVTDNMTIWDRFYMQFYGVSPSGFALPVFLYHCIVFFGGVYLFQMNLNQTMSGLFYYQVLRYRSYYQWMFRFIFRYSLLCLLWFIILAVISVTLAMFQGLRSDLQLNSNPSVSILLLFYHYLFNGWLQMINYFLILFIIHWMWKKQSAVHLAVLGGLIVAGMPLLNLWLPSGLNSLGQLTEDNSSAFFITIRLSIWISLELLILSILFKRNQH